MPNPKWRHSKRRKRARRTHDHALMPTLGTCKTTGEVHMFHRGQVLVPGKARAAAEE